MLNFYSNSVSQNKPKFEDIPLEAFLGSESKQKTQLRAILAKIADNNQTVIAGIESLLAEEVIFRSFERALPLLLNAKTTAQLKRAEASLQITANEIKKYKDKGSFYISNKKISLYLYTLQYLIVNLGKWKLQENNANTYKPSLLTKLHYVKFKCACLGIKKDVIRSECFSTDYQQPYDDNLRNFEYLDDEELDAFIKRLARYEVTRNARDLYKKTSLSFHQEWVNDYNELEILIYHINANFSLRELTLKFYKDHTREINKIISKYLETDDLFKIFEVSQSLKDHLIKEQQFNDLLHRQDGGRTND